MALSWIRDYSVGGSGGSLLVIASGYCKGGVGPRITHLSSQKVDFWLDGGNLVSSLSRDYHMITLYGKYFYLLYLVVKLSSISFHSMFKSVISLLYYLKLTINNPSHFSEAINQHIKTSNPI